MAGRAAQGSSLGDLYAVLGVGPGCSADEVKAAYRKAALRHHPDKGGSAEAFKLVGFAFETLFCPNSRARYDLRRQQQQQAQQQQQQQQHGPAAARRGAHADAARPAGAARPQPGAGAHRKASRGRGGAYSGEAQCRPPRSTASRLHRVLCKMHAILAATCKETRFGMLQALSPTLRRRLLGHIEAWRQQAGSALQKAAGGGGSTREDAEPGSANRGEHVRQGGDLMHAPQEAHEHVPLLCIQDGPCEIAPPAKSVTETSMEENVNHGDLYATNLPGQLGPALAEGGSPAPPKRQRRAAAAKQGPERPAKQVQFPGIYMRRGCRYNFYTAATGIENFTIFSRNVRTLEEAVNYHIALMQVKRAVEAAGGLERPFRERLHAALAASPPIDDLRPSFYTVLTSAKTFGTKKIRSPATIHLEEALEHHRCLTLARGQGAQALREAWVHVMQVDRVRKAGSRGNAIKRPRTEEEAEAVALAAERAAAALAHERDTRAAAREAARRQRARERLEQRMLEHWRRRRRLRVRSQRGRDAWRLEAMRRLAALGERLLALEAKEAEKAVERRAKQVARLQAQRAAARAVEERRAKLEEQRALRTRWKWACSRERTFEDVMRGFPTSRPA